MAHEKNHDYHIIDPSPWPFMGAVSSVLMLSGGVIYMKGMSPALLIIGTLGVLYTMYVWWRDVIAEGNNGVDHTPVVRIGLRMGFIMFIMSEVMFFSAWFWMFFKHAFFPNVDISMSPEELQALSIPVEALTTATADGPNGIFPPPGTLTFDPWDLPLINTLILLLSGVTVTWAHHAIIENKNKDVVWGLMATVALGALFTMFQAYEYTHAGGSFSENIYWTTFFMATGFHGAHVLIGTIFLAVCLYRAQRNEFTPERHVMFEVGGLVLALRRRRVAVPVCRGLHLGPLIFGTGLGRRRPQRAAAPRV